MYADVAVVSSETQKHLFDLNISMLDHILLDSVQRDHVGENHHGYLLKFIVKSILFQLGPTSHTSLIIPILSTLLIRPGSS